MRSYAVLIVALTGTLGALSALADDTPIDIKTDLEGQYFLVEEGGSLSKPTLVVKRVAPDVTHYVKREFDCVARTVRYLGEGGSLEELATAQPVSSEAKPIKKGSIADQLARHVCPDE